MKDILKMLSGGDFQSGVYKKGGGVEKRKKGDIGKSGTQYGYTLKEWEEIAEKNGLLVSPTQWWESRNGKKYIDSFGRNKTIGQHSGDKKHEMDKYGYLIANGMDLGSKIIPLSAKNYVQKNNFSKDKMMSGGDFQSGVYKKGGMLNAHQRYILELEGLSGVRKEAIESYISENNLSDNDVLNIVIGLGRKQLKGSDVSSAVVGVKGNDYSKKIIAFAKDNKGMKMMAGGRFASKDYDAIVKLPNGLFTKKDFEGFSKKEVIEWCEIRGWKYNSKGEELGGNVLKDYEFFVKRPRLVSVSLPNSKRKMATGGALVGNQKRIDMNKNGKIDAEDFKLLRSSMNGAWRNERKHVNKDEDYEVRYARKKPSRTGYKGKRNFEGGGGVNVGYNVFNYTDNIYATDEVFKNKVLANKFIKEFRNRFANQGYYRDNRMNKINIQDIDLLAIPSDFNPLRKMATGGGVSKSMQSKKMFFGGGLKKISTLKKYENFEGKIVITKDEKVFKVISQDKDMVEVINPNLLGTGVRPTSINISEINKIV